MIVTLCLFTSCRLAAGACVLSDSIYTDIQKNLSISGLYEECVVEGVGGDCGLILEIEEHTNNYTFYNKNYPYNDKQSSVMSGKLTIVEEGSEVFLKFTEEFTAHYDIENKYVSFTNYGNSMNPYEYFSFCDKKWVTLVRTDTDIKSLLPESSVNTNSVADASKTFSIDFLDGMWVGETDINMNKPYRIIYGHHFVDITCIEGSCDIDTEMPPSIDTGFIGFTDDTTQNFSEKENYNNVGKYLVLYSTKSNTTRFEIAKQSNDSASYSTTIEPLFMEGTIYKGAPRDYFEFYRIDNLPNSVQLWIDSLNPYNIEQPLNKSHLENIDKKHFIIDINDDKELDLIIFDREHFELSFFLMTNGNRHLMSKTKFLSELKEYLSYAMVVEDIRKEQNQIVIDLELTGNARDYETLHLGFQDGEIKLLKSITASIDKVDFDVYTEECTYLFDSISFESIKQSDYLVHAREKSCDGYFSLENSLNEIYNYIKENKKIDKPSIARVNFYLEKHPIGKDNCRYFNDIAYYIEQSGQYHEAIIILEQIIANFPDRVVAYINLGDAYWELENYEAAKSNYEQYIELMKSQGKDLNRIPQRVYDRIK
ncbi:MAG: tetratricopeptide repeat protein [Bacteroidales bacterium]